LQIGLVSPVPDIAIKQTPRPTAQSLFPDLVPRILCGRALWTGQGR